MEKENGTRTSEFERNLEVFFKETSNEKLWACGNNDVFEDTVPGDALKAKKNNEILNHSRRLRKSPIGTCCVGRTNFWR